MCLAKDSYKNSFNLVLSGICQIIYFYQYNYQLYLFLAATHIPHIFYHYILFKETRLLSLTSPSSTPHVIFRDELQNFLETFLAYSLFTY